MNHWRLVMFHRWLVVCACVLAGALVVPAGALAVDVGDVADSSAGSASSSRVSSSVSLDRGNVLAAIALGVSARDPDRPRMPDPALSSPEMEDVYARDFDEMLKGDVVLGGGAAGTEFFGGDLLDGAVLYERF